MGVTGKEAVTGAFHEVGQAGKELGDALMEHTKKLAEMFLGYESLVKVMETFHGVLEMGGKLDELSDQTGIAAGKLVILQRAFENTGLQADDLGKLVNKMQKFIEGAGDSGSASAEKLAKIGLTTEELKALSPDEQFQKIGTALAAISDPTEKAAMSMEIFGKSGGKTLALFNHLDEEMANAKTEVGSFAEVMDGSASSFHMMDDSLKEIGNKTLEFAAGILQDAMPSLKTLVEYLKNVDATAFGQTFSAAFSKGIDITLSIFRDPGNLFLAFGDALTLVMKDAGNILVNSLAYAIDFMGNYAAKILPDLAEVMESTFRVAVGSVISFFSEKIGKVISDLSVLIPGTIGKSMGEVGEKLIKASQEASDVANVELASAWGKIATAAGDATEQTHLQSTDYFNSAGSAEEIKQRLNKAAESGASFRDDLAASVESAKAMAAFSEQIAKQGQAFENSMIGGATNFHEFMAQGGASGDLAAMSGITPYKTPTNVGPINSAPAGGSSSSGGGRSSGRSSSGPVLSDYAASDKTAADFSAYAKSNQFGHANYNAGDISNKDTVISNLASALSRDANRNGDSLSFAAAKAQAQQMYDDQFNKNKGPQDQGAGGPTGSGSSGTSRPSSPDSGVLGKILEALTSNTASFVGQLNDKLPQHALV
jgi:methyl-accepting chemotaxis protein